MRDGDTYRANRKVAAARFKHNHLCRDERKALGITRSEHDRRRGEEFNPAQRKATAARAAAP